MGSSGGRLIHYSYTTTGDVTPIWASYQQRIRLAPVGSSGHRWGTTLTQWPIIFLFYINMKE